MPYWPGAGVFAFGATVWLFVYCAVYKSVSLRILSCMVRAHAGRLSLDRITDRYILGEFRDRMAVLETMGCVVVRESDVVLTSKGRRTARYFEMAQRCFGIERSGLYGDAAPNVSTADAR